MTEVTEDTMDESYISLEDLGDMTLGGGMSSLPYCGSTLEEERPGSSLSTASRSSRIPVFQRSHSLRVKSSSASAHPQENAKNSSKTAGKGRSDGRPSSRASPSVGKGLVRSASFVSSRGMKGVSSPSSPSTQHTAHHPASRHSLTPDTPRRASHTTSSYSKRSSATGTDRKSHSYAGMGGSWHYPTYHHSHHYSRRPNYLPVSAASSSSQFSSLPTTPASQPETPSRSPDSNELDDADSVKSFGSVSSAVSCDAALTHHSRHQGQAAACGGSSSTSKGGRSFRYVLHCRHNHDHDPDQYLTPTQRAARKIRELKAQLSESRREVQQRDTEIARLTRELVELRLLKARTPHWEDEEDDVDGGDRRRGEDKADGKSEGGAPPTSTSRTHPHANARATSKTSSTPSEGSEPELRRLMENLHSGAPDSAAPQEPPAASPASGSVADTTADSVDLTRSSMADSGHYDDLTSPSLSSRDPLETSRGSLRGHHTEEEGTVEVEEEVEEEGVLAEGVVGSNGGEAVDAWAAVEEAESRLREEYHRREEMLKRNHLEEYHELKEKHNDRVEVLLSKLSDANLKYFELRPLYDQSQERVRELERDVMRLKEELTEAELRHQKMYLQMFLKGQQAARIQAEDDLDGGEEGLPASLTSSGPMMELMRQLSRTEEELEKVKALYHREINCRNNNNNNNTAGRRNGELDPEVTLQFLKSAIYYFFTDRDNAKGHLRAIESILGYSDSERYNIGKVIK